MGLRVLRDLLVDPGRQDRLAERELPVLRDLRVDQGRQDRPAERELPVLRDLRVDPDRQDRRVLPVQRASLVLRVLVDRLAVLAQLELWALLERLEPQRPRVR